VWQKGDIDAEDQDKPKSFLKDSVKSRAIFRYVAGAMVKKNGVLSEQVHELLMGVPAVRIGPRVCVT
jgi:hypothetical protein